MTGGAFAQSVLTGDFGFGYSSATADNITNNGMGVTDADIYWSATEKLDNGDTVGVDLSIDISTPAYGSAATMNETGYYLFASGVKVTGGEDKGGEYLSSGVASAGAGIDVTLDGKIYTARSTKDFISVAVPVADGLKVTFRANEASGGRGVGAANALGVVPTQRDNTVSLDYAAGNLTVNVGYRTYDGTNSSSETIASSLNRGSFNYKIGDAKIGAGYSSTLYGYGNTTTDTLVGFSSPFNGLTVGAMVGYRTTAGSATAANNTTRAGTVINASYPLSKQTSLIGGYYTYDAGNASGNTTGYQIKMFKSF